MNAGPYTAAHLARPLDITRQAMSAKLAGCAPSGPPVMAQGVPGPAWPFGALPGPVQADPTARAEQLNYRNAESLLADPAPRWQSPLPLAEIAPRSLEAAANLQRAMARPIARRNDRDLSAADLEQIGLVEYQQAFGHAISARHWRRLFQRTLERAGGAGEFHRLELYLADRPAQNPTKRRAGECSPIRPLSGSPFPPLARSPFPPLARSPFPPLARSPFRRCAGPCPASSSRRSRGCPRAPPAWIKSSGVCWPAGR